MNIDAAWFFILIIYLLFNFKWKSLIVSALIQIQLFIFAINYPSLAVVAHNPFSFQSEWVVEISREMKCPLNNLYIYSYSEKPKFYGLLDLSQ